MEDGEVVLAGLDEALRFVRLESVTTGASLPEGKTYAYLMDHITAYYTDGTTETISALQADAHGNITVTFDEEKVCDGYDIVFAEDYEMQAGGQVRFHAYTVYRDPEHTHVPDGQTKVTYTNAARSVNSYQLGDETKYVYLNASWSYNMLPTTEHLSVGKLTLCNNENDTLLGRGGNHIGDYFLYEIDLTGSLLEPEVKTYEDLRIVDLLPDGIRYDSIYLLQGVSGLPLLDGGNAYQPEILENYHNSGRTAVIFHLNAENLQRTLATVKLAKVYFWVQIEQSARPGTVRNEVYVVGDNLAEKFIAPAGSGSWSKQGLLVKAGSDFDYLPEIVNETAAVHTGLTVYDTLPRIGDPNLFGASGRGSEFPVRLRGAITPPEGYTVYYTTSPEVYTYSMEELVDSNIWAATVSDYASVTAFKLVAGEGTELAGNSRFQVRIPVCAPKTFDEDFMALLRAKVDQDQASGTVSWLQAVNAFGFRTVQTPHGQGIQHGLGPGVLRGLLREKGERRDPGGAARRGIHADGCRGDHRRYGRQRCGRPPAVPRADRGHVHARRDECPGRLSRHAHFRDRDDHAESRHAGIQRDLQRRSHRPWNIGRPAVHRKPRCLRPAQDRRPRDRCLLRPRRVPAPLRRRPPRPPQTPQPEALRQHPRPIHNAAGAFAPAAFFGKMPGLSASSCKVLLHMLHFLLEKRTGGTAWIGIVSLRSSRASLRTTTLRRSGCAAIWTRRAHISST